MKPSRLWIITLDGSRARFFLKEGAKLTLEEQRAEHHPRTADQGRDKPSRSFDSTPAGRHASQPRKDLHQADEDDFVRTVADSIMAKAAAYDRILLIAAPRALGVIRPKLQDLATPMKQIAKDLSDLNERELDAALEKLI